MGVAPPNSIKKLEKGQTLFKEGDMSNSMYLIRLGMVRIFKDKGDSQIEIDTLRAGQIVGELSFMDGSPRSASAEAMVETELVEISQTIYQNTMSTIPEWVKVLLKAVSGKLRTTTTKLKNLESASKAVDYGDGGKVKTIFLSAHDALKLATAILLVACRNSEETKDGRKIRLSVLERYANSILSVPLAKLQAFIDVLQQAEIVFVPPGTVDVHVTDLNLLEGFIFYLNDENQLDPTKRHDLTGRGFVTMSMIGQHLSRFERDQTTGMTCVNVADIIATEKKNTGREPFTLADVNELVGKGYASTLSLRSGSEALTMIQDEAFLKALKMQRIVKYIDSLNEQKA